MTVRTIIDANINRVSEGLRVVEDWMRFERYYDSMTMMIRTVRHDFWSAVKPVYPEMIEGRSVENDVFASTEEKKRISDEDIPRASFNRIKEGLRVLEEMGKIENKIDTLFMKKLRFRIYEIEKDYYINDASKNIAGVKTNA